MRRKEKLQYSPLVPTLSLMDERTFQRQVEATATLFGWYAYHVVDSRRCTSAGFPDLVLSHPATDTQPARTIFAELKTETGRVSKHQHIWLTTLRASGMDVRVWRPSNEQEIEATLKVYTIIPGVAR